MRGGEDNNGKDQLLIFPATFPTQFHLLFYSLQMFSLNSHHHLNM